MWRYLYPYFPSLDSTTILIAEHNGKIAGHWGMHARELVISQNCKLSAVIFGAGAVHPNYRRIGLHSRLLSQRLQLAKSNGVNLAFGWTQKGSDAYKSDTKFGFVEIRQSAVTIIPLLIDFSFFDLKFMHDLEFTVFSICA